MQTSKRAFFRGLVFSVSLKVDGPRAKYFALVSSSTANQFSTTDGGVDQLWVVFGKGRVTMGCSPWFWLKIIRLVKDFNSSLRNFCVINKGILPFKISDCVFCLRREEKARSWTMETEGSFLHCAFEMYGE